MFRTSCRLDPVMWFNNITFTGIRASCRIRMKLAKSKVDLSMNIDAPTKPLKFVSSLAEESGPLTSVITIDR